MPIRWAPGPTRSACPAIWSARRRDPAALSRVFVMEFTLTLTGAKADERLAAHPDVIHDAALVIARALGADLPEATIPPAARRFVDAAVAALRQARGRAIVLAGRTLAPEAGALVHWINQALDAPVDLVEPADGAGTLRPGSVEALREDLAAGRVGALVIAGVNPAYDCPSLDLPRHMPGLPLSIHHGLWFDETAELCGWHVPAHHPLEAWSDLRSMDGTASFAQPLIRPLYATTSSESFLAMLAGRNDAGDHALVRETWLPRWADSEAAWRKALERRRCGHRFAGADRPSCRPPRVAPAAAAPEGWTLVLHPHHATFDGSRANNAWLQECPAPVGKQVWGNALHLSPADAARVNVADGDVVALTAGAATVQVSVQVMPGQAPGVLGLAVGQGRRRAGAIGTGIGVDAFLLQPAPGTWVVPGVRIDKTGRRQDILTTQNDVRLDGAREDLYPRLVAGQALGTSTAAPAPADFYPDFVNDGPAWAMVIDTRPASAATPASWPARPRTTCRSSAPRRSRAAATCIGCGWTSTTTARPRRRSPAFSRCPACIARTRRASRCAPWRLPSTMAKD